MRTGFILLSGAIVVLGIANVTPAFAQYAGGQGAPVPYPPPHYDRSGYGYVGPRFDDPSLIGANLIREAAQQLVAAPVIAPDGREVGLIRVIEPTADGAHAERIQIMLTRRATVWVDARDLHYDSDRHVAFTDLTREDLWRGAEYCPM
jgi:hypothetical protein